jgi:serine/threonine protein kinase
MIVKTLVGTVNRYNTEYEFVKKLGEGHFGEAFMVRNRKDGKAFAIKKAKERYIGLRDREQKLEEVHKFLKITNFKKRKSSPKSFDYS